MKENAGGNNRRYRRIYFPEELVISGVVATSQDPHAEVPVKVLNLSEGGLFFTLARGQGSCFKEKDKVLLLCLRGPGSFTVSQQLDMEIKWVCDNEGMENIGYGCEFIAPPAGFLDQIRDMVAGFSMESMPSGSSF